MCMERRRFSQTMASEWQTAFVVSHKMPWCALLTAVKNYNKSLQNCNNFSSRPRPRPRPKFKTKTKISWSKTKTKTKTFIFVLEAPRDQDPGLEDYITAFEQIKLMMIIIIMKSKPKPNSLRSFISVLNYFKVEKYSNYWPHWLYFYT